MTARRVGPIGRSQAIGGFFGRISLRGRLMVIGVLGVAGALLIGGVALYAVLAYTGDHTLVAGERATARDVAALVEQHRLPDPIPVTGAQIVQVVDAQNRVVAASVNGDRLTSMLRPAELRGARGGPPLTVSGSRVGLDSPLRVVAIRADRGRTVIVAQQFEDLVRSRQVLRNALLVTFPLLLLVLAAIAWRVIGSALRPVEALRAGAERISGSDSRRARLPVPGSADEIRALALTLNSMLDRLEAARARQRAFVADAAHELRSPLTSMRTQLEVAAHLRQGGAAGDDSAAAKDDTGAAGDDMGGDLPADLLAEVERLSGLVDGLLLLARLDSGDAQAAGRGATARLSVGELLDEVAGRYAAARVPVHVVRPTPGLSVTADPHDLVRVLANLVDNAVRHAGSRVELAACAEGERTLLTVTDDGPGVAAADRERVFARFVRLDEARDRDAGGSGLGLAIVRELVQRAGGRVALADAGPGLRVELRLPR
ncbi:MAG TPA: HAMP domain-containing sensor histidine kinase [Nocardioidaceae bacterium]|nr:HAMP domain-containing sensor histidine kinase [Nocardioidaceae bacterium]